MVARLIGMNYHISNRANYLEKKKKVVHQSQEEEKAKEDAQKNHRVKERQASAEKLGPKNKTTHKLISKS